MVELAQGNGNWYIHIRSFFVAAFPTLLLWSGNTLLRKLVEAMTEAVEHQRAFDEFDQHLCADRLEQVEAWDKEYKEWDEAPTGSPCIFDTKDPGMYSCHCTSYTY